MEDKEAEEMAKSLKLLHFNVQQVISCFPHRFLPIQDASLWSKKVRLQSTDM